MPQTYKQRQFNREAICTSCETSRSIDGDVVVDLYRINPGTKYREEQYLCLGCLADLKWRGVSAIRRPDPDYPRF